MKKMISGVVVILAIVAELNVNVYALDRTVTGFFWPIGEETFDQKCGLWKEKGWDEGCYFNGKYHIGVDMMTYESRPDKEDSHVYAVSDGYIYKKHCSDNSWGPGNCALFIRHKTAEGDVFTGLYGHIRTTFKEDDTVKAGKSLGTTGPWSGGIHLHFGIHPGPDTPYVKASEGIGWGIMAKKHWPNTNGFVDPINFLNTHYPYIDFSDDSTSVDVLIRQFGSYGWYPPNKTCINASAWFKLQDGRVIQEFKDDSVCNTISIENPYILPDIFFGSDDLPAQCTE